MPTAETGSGPTTGEASTSPDTDADADATASASPASSDATAATSGGADTDETTQGSETTGDSTGDVDAPTVYFFSDWSSGLLLDDAWTECLGACDDGMEVLSTAAEGRAFPTENFMRITCWEGSLGWANVRVRADDSNVPEVQIGDSVFFRWYFRPMPGDPTSMTDDNGFHGTEFWANTYRPFGAADDHGMAGWRWAIGVAAAPIGHSWYSLGSTGEMGWNGITGPLARETVYRLEYGMTRTSETEYEVHARVHDTDGTLLYDDEDFTLADWAGMPEATLASDGPFPSDGTEWTNVQDWRLGLNGCSAPYGWGYAEYAAAAICDDWCGAYPIPGVEN